MSPIPANLPPLAPGDIALRFRVEWRGRPARPACIGVQAVGVLSVAGDRVTWTNGLRRYGAPEVYRQTSDRRELVKVEALEALDADFLNALVAEAFCEPVNEARLEEPVQPDARGKRASLTKRPWYQRDLDEPAAEPVSAVA